MHGAGDRAEIGMVRAAGRSAAQEAVKAQRARGHPHLEKISGRRLSARLQPTKATTLAGGYFERIVLVGSTAWIATFGRRPD